MPHSLVESSYLVLGEETTTHIIFAKSDFSSRSPNCSFAHRMTTTRSHAPILDVLMAAGYHFSIPTAPNGSPSLSPEEEEAWMEERRRSLARMRAKREKRRELGPSRLHSDDVHMHQPELEYDSDSGSVSAQGSWSSSAEKRELAALEIGRAHV